jgi:hypothetical protein
LRTTQTALTRCGNHQTDWLTRPAGKRRVFPCTIWSAFRDRGDSLGLMRFQDRRQVKISDDSASGVNSEMQRSCRAQLRAYIFARTHKLEPNPTEKQEVSCADFRRPTVRNRFAARPCNPVLASRAIVDSVSERAFFLERILIVAVPPLRERRSALRLRNCRQTRAFYRLPGKSRTGGVTSREVCLQTALSSVDMIGPIFWSTGVTTSHDILPLEYSTEKQSFS